MNHNKTPNEPLIWRMHFWWFFQNGLRREHVPVRKVLRSLLQVGGVFCHRAEGLKKIPWESDKKISGGTAAPLTSSVIQWKSPKFPSIFEDEKGWERNSRDWLRCRKLLNASEAESWMKLGRCQAKVFCKRAMFWQKQTRFRTLLTLYIDCFFQSVLNKPWFLRNISFFSNLMMYQDFIHVSFIVLTCSNMFWHLSYKKRVASCGILWICLGGPAPHFRRSAKHA